MDATGVICFVVLLICSIATLFFAHKTNHFRHEIEVLHKERDLYWDEKSAHVQELWLLGAFWLCWEEDCDHDRLDDLATEIKEYYKKHPRVA